MLRPLDCFTFESAAYKRRQQVVALWCSSSKEGRTEQGSEQVQIFRSRDEKSKSPKRAGKRAFGKGRCRNHHRCVVYISEKPSDIRKATLDDSICVIGGRGNHNGASLRPPG